MKKLTSLFALLLAMVMLASCGGPAAPQTNPEDEVRAAVTSFMDAVFSMDLEKAKTLATDESVIDELEEKLNLNDITSAFESSTGDMFQAEKITGYVSDLLKKIFSTVKYEVADVNIDGDTAEAGISLTYPDFDSIDMSSADVDFEGLMQEAFGFSVDDISTFMQKYAERKGLTAEELMAQFSNGDQSALMNDLFDTFEPEFKKMFDIMGDTVVKLADGHTTSDTSNVKLEKGEDGTWKIAAFDE